MELSGESSIQLITFHSLFSAGKNIYLGSINFIFFSSRAVHQIVRHIDSKDVLKMY